MQTVKQILDNLSNDIETVVKTVWKNAGIKSNSNLLKSIQVETGINNQLAIYAADYAEFVSSGRKKFSKKIPISVLISFIKKNGINSKYSVNNLAYIIQNSIYKNGIKGKNIISSTEKPLTNIFDKNLDTEIETLLESSIKINKK